MEIEWHFRRAKAGINLTEWQKCLKQHVVAPRGKAAVAYQGLFLGLADPTPGGMFCADLKEGKMAEAKLAPNLPDWMVEHANRYLASGGTDGHMYKVTVPQRGEITAPALLLTTTGRKSGDKFIFPLFYGTDGGSYFVIASKGGAPEHPGWYRNILANPDVEVQVGTKKMNARARTTAGEERLRLWKKALGFWPPYADYQLKTEREIPVVVLDPVH
jgi:proline iminopeptidase